MIEAQDLTREFGAIRAIEDVTFTVAKGRIAGFLGVNGAGKSTTLRILAGIFPPTRGRARIAGFDVVDESLAARTRLGYFPENAPFYDGATVEPYLDFVATMKGLARRERRRQVAEAIEACGLRDVSRRRVGRLSKGYRQRVGLAQALIGRPEVLLLDEPTAGLDPEQVTEVRRLIASLRGDRTILLSSHILSEVSALCDRVIVIDGGRVVAEDSPERLAARLQPAIRVRVRLEAPQGEVVALLRAVPGIAAVTGDPLDRAVRFEARDDSALREASIALQQRRWPILEMSRETPSLEDVFLALVRAPGAPAGVERGGPS